ncbi:hypothetical protein Tco_1147300 [Tanacetum coccineum]
MYGLWIGPHRIHVNAGRFHRPKGSTSSHQPAMKGKIRDSSIGNTKDNGHRDDVKEVRHIGRASHRDSGMDPDFDDSIDEESESEKMKNGVEVSKEGIGYVEGGESKSKDGVVLVEQNGKQSEDRQTMGYIGGLYARILKRSLNHKEWMVFPIEFVVFNIKGSVIIMGDFNEVRNKNERFGTIFNVHGANAFNSFISMANLEEVHLVGCSIYMVVNRSASIMIADRFLMSESLLMALGVVVSRDSGVQAANRIGCGVLKAPFAYLGLKVRGNMSRIKSWDEIVDKMVDRLSKWKMKTLSIGGRLTLLKAVLGSMPIYHMSIFKVPMKV